MNDLQKVASLICGYEHNQDFTSAKNDYYYDECDTREKKISQVLSIADSQNNVVFLDEFDAEKIIEFLDGDFSGSNEMYQAYENLK